MLLLLLLLLLLLCCVMAVVLRRYLIRKGWLRQGFLVVPAAWFSSEIVSSRYTLVSDFLVQKGFPAEGGIGGLWWRRGHETLAVLADVGSLLRVTVLRGRCG